MLKINKFLEITDVFSNSDFLQVHDLLDPQTNKRSLKVREHNVMGPYVDGLSQLAVTSFEVNK